MHVEPRAPSAGARPQHPRRAVFPAHAGNRHNTVGAARSPLIAQPCTGRSTAIPVFPPLVCTDCRQRINSDRHPDCCRSVPPVDAKTGAPCSDDGRISSRSGGSVWESNPPPGSRRVGSMALKATRITGPLSPPVRIIAGAALKPGRQPVLNRMPARRAGGRAPRPCASRVCASGCATKQDSYRNLHGNLYCRTQVFPPL